VKKVFSSGPLKKYFITGLLIWIPLIITLWVLKVIFDTLDAFDARLRDILALRRAAELSKQIDEADSTR